MYIMIFRVITLLTVLQKLKFNRQRLHKTNLKLEIITCFIVLNVEKIGFVLLMVEDYAVETKR